jgi:hypothetical protein
MKWLVLLKLSKNLFLLFLDQRLWLLSDLMCTTMPYRNLQLLSALLERYERETGLTIVTDGNNNLVVPLGPDLQATVTYGLRP